MMWFDVLIALSWTLSGITGVLFILELIKIWKNKNK